MRALVEPNEVAGPSDHISLPTLAGLTTGKGEVSDGKKREGSVKILTFLSARVAVRAGAVPGSPSAHRRTHRDGPPAPCEVRGHRFTPAGGPG